MPRLFEPLRSGPLSPEAHASAVPTGQRKPLPALAASAPETPAQRAVRERKLEEALFGLSVAAPVVRAPRIVSSLVGGLATQLASRGDPKSAMQLAANITPARVAAPVVAALTGDAGDAEAALLDQIRRGVYDDVLAGYVRGNLPAGEYRWGQPGFIPAKDAVKAVRRLDDRLRGFGIEAGEFIGGGKQGGVYALVDDPRNVIKFTYERPMALAAYARDVPLSMKRDSNAVLAPSFTDKVSWLGPDLVHIEVMRRGLYDLRNAIDRGLVTKGEGARILERLVARMVDEGIYGRDLHSSNVVYVPGITTMLGAADNLPYRVADRGFMRYRDNIGDYDIRLMLEGAQDLWKEAGKYPPLVAPGFMPGVRSAPQVKGPHGMALTRKTPMVHSVPTNVVERGTKEGPRMRGWGEVGVRTQ